MATKPVGTMFVELDLDASRYTRGQQRLLRDAQSTTLNIEQNFRNLGIKSSAEMDLMRAKIKNSFNMIANSSKATANDILRAERAKNEQLAALNKQQYGDQMGWLTKMRSAVFSLRGALAGLGVGLGIGSVIKGVIDTAASFEMLEVKLDALTRGRGKETLEELNAWAKDMPVNTQQAVDAFAMMQAMGLEPTIEKMQTLTDVAAIFGEDAMPRVARALGQMQTLGKLSAEELNQLSEAGINARKYLTEAFGMGVEELRKSSVQIEEIIGVIWRGLDADYSGAARRSMNSWRGMMIQFRSNITELERQVANAGFFDALKDGLQYVNAGMSEWIKNNQEFIRQDLPGHIRQIVDAVKAVGEAVALRSVTETFFEGAAMSRKGLLDWEAFYRADFTARQKMVDRVKADLARTQDDLQEAYRLGLSPRAPLVAPEKLRALQEQSPARVLAESTRKDQAELKRLMDEIAREQEKFAESLAAASPLEEFLGTGVGPAAIDRMERERLARIREEAKKVHGEDGDWITRHREEIGPYEAERVKRTMDQIKNQGEESMGALVQLSERTAEAMQANFSSLFFDAMKGELKSLEDYVNAVMDSILRAISDMAGQLATQAIFGGASVGGTAGGGGLVAWLAGLFGGGGGGAMSPSTALALVRHAGGPVDGSGPHRAMPAWMFAAAPRLHKGLAPDEYPAILQRGERVLSRREASRPAASITINVAAPGGRMERESLSQLQAGLLSTLSRAYGRQR